jgi:hypothetical protein
MEEVDPLDGPLLDFAELKRLNIVESHPHLTSLIKDHGFPPGFWIGHRHKWTQRSVREWLATRPTAQPLIVRARAAKSVAVRKMQHCAKETPPALQQRSGRR